MSVVTFTPVYQSDDILELHLEALEGQGVDSWFYDDNDTATPLLKGRRVLPRIDGLPGRGDYKSAKEHHNWNRSAVARVARIKNWALRYLLESQHDWIFLVDSDVLTPPGLVDHLLEANTPIISAVYWSDWGEGPMPNVWDFDQYGFGPDGPERFRQPGHHRVGGLGACTLLHRKAVEVGVNFNQVFGVSWWGEDRHLSIRANAADIPLVACTHHEVFHIYHDNQLEEGRQWLTSITPQPSPVSA